jgi:hypothetical protein
MPRKTFKKSKRLFDFDSLVHNDTHGIVQYTLSKDDAVQFWIDLVLLEDGKDGNWIRGGQG